MIRITRPSLPTLATDDRSINVNGNHLTDPAAININGNHRTDPAAININGNHLTDPAAININGNHRGGGPESPLPGHDTFELAGTTRVAALLSSASRLPSTPSLDEPETILGPALSAGKGDVGTAFDASLDDVKVHATQEEKDSASGPGSSTSTPSSDTKPTAHEATHGTQKKPSAKRTAGPESEGEKQLRPEESAVDSLLGPTIYPSEKNTDDESEGTVESLAGGGLSVARPDEATVATAPTTIVDPTLTHPDEPRILTLDD